VRRRSLPQRSRTRSGGTKPIQWCQSIVRDRSMLLARGCSGDMGVLPRSVAGWRRVLTEQDTARLQAENMILQEIGDERFRTAETAPIIVP
jgi:hypothetical protein